MPTERREIPRLAFGSLGMTGWTSVRRMADSRSPNRDPSSRLLLARDDWMKRLTRRLRRLSVERRLGVYTVGRRLGQNTRPARPNNFPPWTPNNFPPWTRGDTGGFPDYRYHADKNFVTTKDMKRTQRVTADLLTHC